MINITEEMIPKIMGEYISHNGVTGRVINLIYEITTGKKIIKLLLRGGFIYVPLSEVINEWKWVSSLYTLVIPKYALCECILFNGDKILLYYLGNNKFNHTKTNIHSYCRSNFIDINIIKHY